MYMRELAIIFSFHQVLNELALLTLFTFESLTNPPYVLLVG